MIYTVIGITRRQGIYQGSDYDTTTIHTTFEPFPSDDLKFNDGLSVRQLKVKTPHYDKMVAVEPISIGDDIDARTDKFGNLLSYVRCNK